MWKLLFAEILYRRTVILISLVMALLMSALYILLNDLDPGMSTWALTVMLILCIGLVWLARLADMQKEKSDRMIRLLPVKPVCAGLFRMMFLPAVWLLLLAIYAGTRILGAGNAGMGAVLPAAVPFTGIFLLANSLTLINHDHRFCMIYKPLKVTLTAVISLVMLGGYVIFVLLGALGRELGGFAEHAGLHLTMFISSTAGTAALAAGGLLLSLISAAVYTRRISYRD